MKYIRLLLPFFAVLTAYQSTIVHAQELTPVFLGTCAAGSVLSGIVFGRKAWNSNSDWQKNNTQFQEVQQSANNIQKSFDQSLDSLIQLPNEQKTQKGIEAITCHVQDSMTSYHYNSNATLQKALTKDSYFFGGSLDRGTSCYKWSDIQYTLIQQISDEKKKEQLQTTEYGQHFQRVIARERKMYKQPNGYMKLKTTGEHDSIIKEDKEFLTTMSAHNKKRFVYGGLAVTSGVSAVLVITLLYQRLANR